MLEQEAIVYSRLLQWLALDDGAEKAWLTDPLV
jgi:hypothetical protein